MTEPGPGQVLFEFVRHWSRRSADDPDLAEQGRLVLVCEAVRSLTERGVEPTVNEIARDVGLDQSGASRLVRTATAKGLLRPVESGTDGRRRVATVTAAGQSMIAQAHRWQEEVFDRLTDGWSSRRREEFQRAMADLMEQSYATRR